MNKVFFLGPEGSYSNLALNYFINYYKIKPKKVIALKTIKQVINELKLQNSFCCACVPIENSTYGVVRETIDNLIVSENIKVKAEYTMDINHSLICNGKKENIKKIISHPQALNQCENYINKNFDINKVEIMPSNSTSEAIYSLLEADNTTCAIGSSVLGKKLKLNIIENNINDLKDNKTRFYFLTNNQNFLNENNTKTSVVFSLKNKIGALIEALNIYKKYEIDLTYIDSRPSKRVKDDYVFFTEFKGDVNENRIKKAYNEIENISSFIKIIGSYKELGSNNVSKC